MNKNTYLYFLISILLFSYNVHSQQEKNCAVTVDSVLVKAGNIIIIADSTFIIKEDTVFVISDTTQYKIKENPYLKSDAFYDSLKAKTSNNKLIKALHDAVIMPSSKFESDTTDFVRSVDNFLPFKGKTIGKIYLKKVDVYAGSVNDTLMVAEAGFSKTLNNIHVKTRDRVIIQNLVFKQGDELDPYTLSDNERILRSLSFIEDAKILVIPHTDSSNVVDIIVITKDVFSLGITGRLSDINKFKVKIFDRNLFGSGTELNYTFRYKDENPPTGHDVNYIIHNIRGTFISCLINYVDNFGTELLRAYFRKQFLTPQTRYAGAVDIGKSSDNRVETNKDIKIPYTQKYQDVWIGRSFLIAGKHSRKNIIVSGRFNNIKYTERPNVSADSNYFFHNYQLLLGSISYRKTNYFKSSMILSFGVTEDVPVGYVFKLTSGLKKDEFVDKPYIGAEISAADICKNAGYFAIKLGAGSFYKKNKFVESLISAGGLYYSKLIKMRRYRVRYLTKLNYIIGKRLFSDEPVNFSGTFEGFSKNDPIGTQKLTLTLGATTFTPWYFYGFRCSLFSVADFGCITFKENLFTDKAFYGSIAIGCNIRNESLVFKTIQLSLHYFLRAPEDRNLWYLDFSTRDPELFKTVDITKPDVIKFE